MFIYMLTIFWVFNQQKANKSLALYCNNRTYYVQISNNIPSAEFQHDLFPDIIAVSSRGHYKSSNYYTNFSENVMVEPYLNNRCTVLNDTYRICQSLEDFFLGNVSFSNTCCVISKSIQLQTNFSLTGITGFTLMGTNNIKVECNNAGISVVNSSDVIFKFVSFEGCGQKFLITSHLIEKKYPLLSAAIYFKNVNNFLFDGVNLFFSLGYSLIMLNSASGSFIGCNFGYSQASNLEIRNFTINLKRNCSYAGGLYIDYYGKRSIFTNDQIMFQNTYFQNNKNNIKDCNMKLGHDTPIKNGGGISLIIRDGIRYKNILFKDYSQILDNEATSSGGGVYIFMAKGSQSNIVQFQQTFIQRNIAYYTGGGVHLNNLGIDNTLLMNETSYIDSNFAQNGGGIFVRLKNDSINSKITLNETKILFNSANSTAGGIYIADHGKNNTIQLNQCDIYQNQARQIGGGINVILNRSSSKSTICFRNSNIFENKASFSGGGMQIFNRSTNSSIHLVKSNVFSNEANIGSNMMIYSAMFKFDSVLIYNGTNNISHINSSTVQGSLYADNSELYFLGNNLIKKNNWSAVILDFSKIVIENTLIFHENIGQNGGALVLLGQSQIVLKNNSILSFEENKALNSGGAIYVLVPGPRFRPWLPSPNKKYCFFQIDETSTVLVTFTNNSANNLKGHDIFVSALNTCRSNFEENAFSIISSWSGFNFSSFKNNSIVTDAVAIDVNLQQIKQPGKKFNLTVLLRDEREQVVDELVTIIANATNIRKYKTNQGVVEVTFYGAANSKIPILLIAESISKRITVTLPNCSYGYEYDAGSKSCKCSSRTPNVEVCTDDSIRYRSNKWISSSNKMYPCPINLCRDYSTYDKYDYWFDETNQCVNGRNSSSVLCSECLPGYSVSLKNSSCIKCPHNHNIAILVIILVLVITFHNSIIVFLNYKSFAWYLIPTIYFYASVNQIFTAMEDDSNLTVNIASLLGMNIKFDLISNIIGCIESINDFLKNILLRYIVGIIWLLSFSIVAMLTHRFLHLKKEVIERSLAIVSFIVYCIITEVSFQLMLYIDIDGGEKRLWISPSQLYFKDLHQWLLIIAVILMVVIGLMFPIAIIVLTHFYEEDTVNKKILFFLYYSMGLEKNKRWVCCLYFFAKVLMTLLVGLGSCSEIHLLETWKAVTCLIVLWFLLLTKPYKKRKKNIFHIVVSTSALTIASINNSFKFEFSIYKSSSDENVYFPIARVAATLPLLLCLYEATSTYRKTRKNKDESYECPPIVDDTE